MPFKNYSILVLLLFDPLFKGQGRNPYKIFVGFLVFLKTPKGHFEIKRIAVNGPIIMKDCLNPSYWSKFLKNTFRLVSRWKGTKFHQHTDSFNSGQNSKQYVSDKIYLHLVVTNFLDFFCGCHQQYLQNPRFEFSWDFETHFVTKLWIQELFSENQLLLCIRPELLYLGLVDVFLKTVAIHLRFQQT